MVNTSKVKVAQSYLTHFNPWTIYSPWNSPGQNTGVGSCSLLQGIFPTQELNPGLTHCWWVILIEFTLSMQDWFNMHKSSM